MSETPGKLPRGWYTLVVSEGVDRDLPGIYAWQIEGVGGAYIGKYEWSSRPIEAYTRNVTNLLNDRPYRKSKPDGFRPIHRALARAVRERRPVTLTLGENVPVDKIHQREDELQKEYGLLEWLSP